MRMAPPSSESPVELIVAIVRAINHLSIRQADMPGGYHGGIEYDPEHTTIYLDRSCTDRELAAELAHELERVLPADRENTRAMLRALTSEDDRAVERQEPADGTAKFRRRALLESAPAPCSVEDAPRLPHDLRGC